MKPEFAINYEWIPAPGVRDPLLAATWAQYELIADGEPITQLVDLDSRSVRRAAYGSLLPLVEWVLGNWWSLLHEGWPQPITGCSRELVGLLGRSRLERHSPIFSRQGQAYPDFRIAAHGESCLLRWFQDPRGIPHRRSRFIGEGEVVLDRQAVEESLARLVVGVIERLKNEVETGWEDLEEEWNTIQTSMAEEPDLCRHVARLGEDPYDVSGDVLEQIQEALGVLPGVLFDELTSAVGVAALRQGLSWVQACRDLLVRKRNRSSILDLRGRLKLSPRSSQPWETGYRRARDLRLALGVSDKTVLDPDRALLADLQLDRRRDVIVRGLGGSGIEALAGATEHGSAGIYLTCAGPVSARRFCLARAIYGLLATPSVGGSVLSLLTEGHTVAQAESRAFAAELLLPASALREELTSERIVEEGRIEVLARKYRVSPLLVTHQVENHRIAAVPVACQGPRAMP